MTATPKPGGLLDRATKQTTTSGICPTCANLMRVSDTALGCVAHDKLIMPDYLPYHGTHELRQQCPDWAEKSAENQKEDLPHE